MQGIRPQTLTTAELVRYAHNLGPANLPADWVAELLKRLEQTLDDNK